MEAPKKRGKNFANFITNLHEDDTAEVDTIEQDPQLLTLRAELEDTVSELSPLSDQEQNTRNQLEDIIQTGLDTYLTVGTALYQIRQAKLYRSTHLSLKAYLAERFDVGRQRAYQLMEAAQVVNELMADAQTGDEHTESTFVTPKKESHASALADVPEDQRRQVWDAVVKDEKQTGKPITAKKIQAKAEGITGVPRNKKAPKDRKSRTDKEPADEFTTDQTSLTVSAMGQPRETSSIPDANWLSDQNQVSNSDNSFDQHEAEERVDNASPEEMKATTSQPLDEQRARLQFAFQNAKPGDLMLRISGRLLLTEQVAEDWKTLRQDDRTVDEEFSDSITLEEALDLGILAEFIKKWQ